MKPEKPENNLSLVCLNVRSLEKHLEDLEALVFCLEPPPLVLCLTEIWLTKNDIDQSRVVGYTDFEASHRSICYGGAMMHVLENSNFIQTYESAFEESIIVLIDAWGFQFRLLCIYNPPRNNRIVLFFFDEFLERRA